MTIIFLILAGILNAIMDTLQDHFGTSIFSGFNPQIWNPAVSWKNHSGKGFLIETVFVMFTDIWHLAKFLMIMCICLACIYGEFNPVNIAIYYLAFTCSFTLFYSWALV